MKSKKNIKSILIITAIISLVFFNKSFAANTAKVVVDTANIRKTADANSTILDQVFQNQEVEIIEKSGDWYKVKYKNIVGYLRNDLIQVSNSETIQSNEQQSNQTQSNEQQVTQTQNNEQQTTQTQGDEQQASQTQNNNTQSNEIQNSNSEKQDYQSGMYSTKEVIKLKIIPLINGSDIKQINQGITVNVLEVYNNWALIESGTDRGWVIFNKLQKVEENQPIVNEEKNSEPTSQDKTKETESVPEQNATAQEAKVEEKTPEKTVEQTPEKTMFVNSDVVNLRKEASTSSESLEKLTKATQVTVVSEENGWSKVKVNNKEGYISSSLLSQNKPMIITSRSLEEGRKELQVETTQSTVNDTNSSQVTTTQTNSNKGEEVVSVARNYIGCKYIYGGTSPSGFDCSGFTQYVYKQFGVSLNRTAESQASNGIQVSKSELKAGDLVIFTSHVGIYAGDGTFIHAANAKKGVTTTSMSDSYYVTNYITARRIFN